MRMYNVILFGGFFAFLTTLAFMSMQARDVVAEDVSTSGPVVIELYTSQSCSSCPPADKLLGSLADASDDVIALAYHVTYWNHLHWKDKLSLEESTDHQRTFNRNINSRRVYTPQMVVNGRDEFVGSSARKAAAAIGKNTAIQPIKVSLNNGQVSAKIPADLGKNVQVQVVGFGDKNTQAIPSGENRGRTLTYTNPVQSINYVNAINGALSVAASSKVTGGYAVLVRDIEAGKVIAAGQVKL